jgi:hypothetical protein
MSFPANEVESALLAASTDERRMGQLLAALRAGQLWVPVTSDPADGRPVTLYTVEVEARPHTVVFTSLEQLEQWAPGAPHVVAPTPSFVQSLPPAVGLAINPGGELGLPLGPESVVDLGPAEKTIPAGTRIRIGEPAIEPVEVLKQIGYALGDVPEVQSARRAWVQVADEPPSLAIGLALTEQSATEPVLAAVRDALDDILRRNRPGFAIDLVGLDDPVDPIAAWMNAHAACFHEAPA